MLRIFINKFHSLWHDVYYKFSGDRGIEFAMRCRDVATIIDMHEPPRTWLGRFRFRLHLSLCQACKNYYSVSVLLRTGLKKLIAKRNKGADNLERLNKTLLKTLVKTFGSQPKN